METVLPTRLAAATLLLGACLHAPAGEGTVRAGTVPAGAAPACTAPACTAPACTAPVSPVLRVVLFDPADRTSPPDTRERLDRAMTAIQAWYRAEMERNGFGARTFPLERDARGELVVHHVRSTRAYAPGEEIGEEEIREAQVVPALRREGIDADREHLVVFANTVFATEEERGTVLRSWSVYGGLGDQRSGTAWVTDCALLDPRNLEAREPIVWDGGERRYTLGRYNSVYLGGVAHELGHAFGLPHDVETEEQHARLGWALMGSGNYHLFGKRAGEEEETFLSRAEATMLAFHPLFRVAPFRDTHASADERVVRWSDPDFEALPGAYVVRGRVETTPPAHAVIAFHDGLADDADYDATAWVAAVGPDGRFEVRVETPVPGLFELRLRCCLVDGAERTRAWRLRIDEGLALVRAEVEPVEVEPVEAEEAEGAGDAAGGEGSGGAGGGG